MFKINKSLRRLGIVSVSALMLLGVGASAMGSANTPVHADVSNAQIMNSSYANSIPKVDIEQEKAEAQNELNDAKKHPSDAEGDLVNVKEDTDIYNNDPKLRKIVNQDWKKLPTKSAGISSQKASGRKSLMKSHKKQHVSNKGLSKQIHNLENRLYRIRRGIMDLGHGSRNK